MQVVTTFVVRDRMEAAVPYLVPENNLPQPPSELATSSILHAPHTSVTLTATDPVL